MTHPSRLSTGLGPSTSALVLVLVAGTAAQPPRFDLVQPELFAASGAQPNAWADFDGDGDLDLFVGFRQDEPNRLYRNDRGTFVNVAADAGVADLTDTRAASWGDFDGDGDPDLFVGFTRQSETPARLYRNDGPGKPFTDVATAIGVDAVGETRQPSFVDFDNDGDLDLFVAMRDAPNMLFRNDGSALHQRRQGDWALTIRAAPSARSGSTWTQDGDLDVFVANQNGDPNGLFRNDGASVRRRGEATLGMDAAGRAADLGQQRPQRRRLRPRRRSRSLRRRLRAELPLSQRWRGKFTEVAASAWASPAASRPPRRDGATSTTTAGSTSTCRHTSTSR